jgi:hypothetical protein
MRAKRREACSDMLSSKNVSARNRPSDVGHCGGLRRKIIGRKADCPVAAPNYFRRHCHPGCATSGSRSGLSDLSYPILME